MGINGLNVFIRRRCTTASNYKIHLKELHKKSIVVDASIYMYKFLEKNALMENMDKMISIFKQYSIKPIFVFDGKRPNNTPAIKSRQKEKKDGIYEDNDNTENTTETDDSDFIDMPIKKKSTPTVKLSAKDIFQVKEMLKK